MDKAHWTALFPEGNVRITQFDGRPWIIVNQGNFLAVLDPEQNIGYIMHLPPINFHLFDFDHSERCSHHHDPLWRVTMGRTKDGRYLYVCRHCGEPMIYPHPQEEYT